MAVPVVTSCTPNNGKLAGGTSVTLAGSNFTGTLGVTFGGVAATNVIEVSDIEITCDTPANAAGTIDIVVTNGDGPGTGVGLYTYNPLPTFAYLGNPDGKLAGGNFTTAHGTGFMAGAIASFDGVASPPGIFVDPTELANNQVPGPHAAGAVDVTITNPDTQSVTALGAYTYNPLPTFTSITPNNGKLAAGQAVVILGTGFLPTGPLGPTITFGGTPQVEFKGSTISPTEIHCTAPAHVAGTVDVVVTNSDTQDTGAGGTGAYTYNPSPTFVSATPDHGILAGGASVVIAGTGFLTGAAVTFGGTPAGVVVDSDIQITCTTPAHVSGTVNIVITNLDTQFCTGAGAYTYDALPTVTSAVPIGGPLAGGTSAAIAGTGFQAGATVDFGGTPATGVVVNSAISITCDTPAHAGGLVNVVVTNLDTQFGTGVGIFTYQNAPTVVSATPSDGIAGNLVTIAGTGFLAGAAVDFDGVPAGGVVVNSPISISCFAPAHAAGAASVTVTNLDGQFGTGVGVFVYDTHHSVYPPFAPPPYPLYVPPVAPTGNGPRVDAVSAAPLVELPFVPPAQRIDWTPNTGPQATVRATAPLAAAQASILLSDGTVFPGSSAPYVAGDGPGTGDESGAAHIVSTDVRLIPKP